MPANLFRRGDSWYGRFFVAGQLQRVSLRTGDLREARARLRALRQKAERQAFGIVDAATWEEAVLAYTRGVIDSGSVKASTAKRYVVSLRQLHDAFAGRKLPAIGATEIAAYVRARQAGGTTNATIRRDLTAISRVLAYARSNQMVNANAADDYDRSLLRERRGPIRAPSAEAIGAGVSACEAAGAPELGRLIQFLRANGTRTGEALRARWRDIDSDRLTIHETKAGRVRTITLVADSLPPAAKPDARIFPGLPENTGALASRWQWIRRALPDDQHFRLHDLRHAYAIAEIQAGRDIYDLSHHLGHGSVSVTEIYLGYVPGGRARGRER
jgi:integrase